MVLSPYTVCMISRYSGQVEAGTFHPYRKPRCLYPERSHQQKKTSWYLKYAHEHLKNSSTSSGPLVAHHAAAKTCSLRVVLTTVRQHFDDLRSLSCPESSWWYSLSWSHISLTSLQFCGAEQTLLCKSGYGNLAEMRGGWVQWGPRGLLTDTWVKFKSVYFLTCQSRILEFEDHVFHFGKKDPWDFVRNRIGSVDWG